MPFRSERAAVVVFALARLLFCAWRAAGQSITIDEAYTYLRFLSGPWSAIYAKYDANNHVLYSILAKLSVQCFGLSEFTLRLPSLIAGFFLTLGIFEVLRLCTRPLAVRWVAFVALSLHPLLLDFSIAARGYGMGLAFLVWAMFFVMQRRFFASGTLIGLALGASFTIAFPAAGLFGAVLLLDPVSIKERLRDLAVMLAPAETIFFAICFGALRTASAGLFYVGAPTLRDSIGGMVEMSILVTRRSALIGGPQARHFFETVMIPLILVFIAAATTISFFKLAKERLRLLPIFMLALASAAVLASHAFFDLLYPADRTGLYLVLLFGLAWAAASDQMPRLRNANLALGLLIALQFASQLHGGYFTLWREGSRIKDASLVLRRLSAKHAVGSVKISTSWYHQSAMEFYREQWNIAEWAPVVRHDSTEFAGNDFYVFNNEDPQKIKDAGIRILFRDPPSKLVVGMNWPAGMRP